MKISYFLGMQNPETHYFRVRIVLEECPEEILLLTMPAWTPGSYVIRDFARNVRSLSASSNGYVLESSKKDKSTWKIMTGRKSPITVEYEVYADEDVPQTSHLDFSHALINGTSVFLYPEGYKEQTLELTLEIPPEWKVSSALEKISDHRFRATNYDILVDSPIEVGNHELLSFRVEGKDHEIAIHGKFMEDRENLVRDMTRIVEAYQKTMGQLPYRKYLFIIHLQNEGNGYGGLEHSYSTVINYDANLIADKEGYREFLGVVAHEFFHLWNVKRIRPAELVQLNYREETYTPSLWFSEGITEYYASLTLLRSGILTEEEFLKKIAQNIRMYELIPGRKYYSAAEASFDAWIKLYKYSPNNINSYVSYYLKGMLIGMVLSRRIVSATRGNRSLDDLMRLMMEKYRKDGRGFTGKDIIQNLREVTGTDMSETFQQLVRSRDEIDFMSELASVGLSLEQVPADSKKVSTGIILKKSGEKFVIESLIEGTPAYSAGLNSGDEIVAVSGTRFTEAFTRKPLNRRIVTDNVLPDANGKAVYHVFRKGELMSFVVDAAYDPFFTYSLKLSEEAADNVKAMRNRLLYG
ncbi:MAG: M61 family metallopeptidase [Thermoplasmataceae archaeon]